MPIQISCSNPQCRQPLACPDDLAGGQVQCPKCGSVNPVPARRDAPPAQGMRLGHYRLIRKLGEGGMGSVFEAIQDGLNRRVALKILPQRLLTDSAYLERFQREARAAASLNHPNIVTVYDIGHDRGHHFFSMEFVDGESLQKRLEREGKLPLPEALSIVIRVADALDYAWKHTKIIHRDIKPDNILLTREKHVKLADLGLAKSTQEETGVTTTDTAIGSPAYMAPEQARAAKDVDCRADIYSLGITFFHLVTGHRPFQGSTPLAVQLAHQEQPFPDPRQHEPSLPPSVCAVLRRMCGKTPEERYQTPEELLADLEKLKEGRLVVPPLSSRQTGPRPAQPGPRHRTTALPPVQGARLAGRRPASGEEALRSKLFLFAAAGLAVAAGVVAALLFDWQFSAPGPEPGLTAPITTVTSPPPAEPTTTASAAASTTVRPPDERPQATPSTKPSGTAPPTAGVESAVPGPEARPAQPSPNDKPAGDLSVMLDYAENYAKEKPSDFARIIERFETIREQGKGTQYGFKAEDLAEKWRAQWETAAQAELEKRKAEAERLSQAARFEEAGQLWRSFPENLRSKATAAALEEEERKLRARIDALARDLDHQTDAIVGKDPQTLTEADVRALLDLKARSEGSLSAQTAEGPQGSNTRILSAAQVQSFTAIQTKIQSGLLAWERVKAVQRARAYEAFWDRYAQLVKERKFDEAKASVLANRPVAEPATMDQHFRDVETLGEMLGKAEQNLPSLIGRTIRLGDRDAKVSQVQAGKLVVSESGAEVRLGVEKLDPELLLELALKGEADPQAVAGRKALFYFFFGRPAQIGKAFDEARSAGIDLSLLESRFAPLLLVTSDPPGAAVDINPQPGNLGLSKLETPLRTGLDKNKTYTLQVSKEGFETATETFEVGQGGVYRKNFALKKPKTSTAFHQDFEIPQGPKDNHGNAVQKGSDKKTGHPLEVRHKDTGTHFVFIPAGPFLMGSPPEDGEHRDDETQHPVRLSQPFYMGKYEVTVGELRRFVQKTDYRTDAERGEGGNVYENDRWVRRQEATWKKPGFEQAEDHPVVMVSWNDAQEYLRWLNGNKGSRFQLPTEAQWEFACRAGSTARFSFGDDPDNRDIPKHAWFNASSGSRTHPVGEKEVSPWNLHDLHGNAWEWCADWYSLYPKEEQADPVGPERGTERVFRGGSWLDTPANVRCAVRNRAAPDASFSSVGFRVVRPLP
ncbi:MAG: SUMF1/EgtB/PvdO family nonheme iron enzyme [Planctomycetes bacterium]|nr:SUMF1/EgtB/PvdO family nonheme iron enzyme [Planctomycetota bacterium]